jgi:4-amino-4-deoxy-L-arabinose transferase-like glycosyltransferase
MSPSPFFFSDYRAHFAALAAVVAAAIALRLSLFGGYDGLDDAEYARIAYQIANGTFSLDDYAGPPVFPLRMGLILPTSLFFRVLGQSEWTMVLFPLILSIAALPLIYVCTTCFFSHRAGLVATALLAITPIELVNATKLVPDLPAAFFAALGVTLIALFGRASAGRGSALFWGGCLAGISFGLSWLCKEAIAYLVPFCIAYIAISFRKDRRATFLLWAGVATGSIGTLFGEVIIYLYLTGDPVFRFHEIERNYRELENGFFTKGSSFGWREGESYARAVVKRLLIGGPNLVLLNSYFLFLPLIGLIAAFHGWYSKDKAFLIPSLWLVTLVLMFNFASSSLSSYMPVALFDRYFYPIIFPSIVLASGLIGKLIFGGGQAPVDDVQRERRFWGALVAGALLLTGGYHAQSAVRSPASTWASEFRDLRSFVQPASLLYTDTLSRRGLGFYWGYPAETKWIDFADVDSADQIRPGSLVLINTAYVDWLNRNAGMWLSPSTGYRNHDFYQNPPDSWNRIWQKGTARLYLVGGSDRS